MTIGNDKFRTVELPISPVVIGQKLTMINDGLLAMDVTLPAPEGRTVPREADVYLCFKAKYCKYLGTFASRWSYFSPGD
jgi:hypothetical protein